MNQFRNPLIKLAILFVIFASMFVFGLLSEDETLTKVQSGDLHLSCLFSDGWRDVEPAKVIDRDLDHGYWIFTNGYAKSCRVY